ncbi:hypothetical protein BH11PSE2_BH11PSE2_08110 [soil metagenome]
MVYWLDMLAMTLSIRHPRADQLARAVAGATGKPITDVIVEALELYAARQAELDQRDDIERALAMIAETDSLAFRDAIDEFNAEAGGFGDYRLAS